MNVSRYFIPIEFSSTLHICLIFLPTSPTISYAFFRLATKIDSTVIFNCDSSSKSVSMYYFLTFTSWCISASSLSSSWELTLIEH